MISEKLTITVKRELPATRCEICHQADCFEPETNVCMRCTDLLIPGKSVPLIYRSSVFDTLSGYQPRPNRMQDWVLGVIAVLPVLFLVVGWFSESDDKTMLWWEIAYGSSLLWLMFNLFFRKEEEVEGVDGLLLLLNVFITLGPIVLLILFFLIAFLARHF